MMKLFFLMIFFLVYSHPLKALETPSDDQEFLQQLDNVKNPFEDGLPKPVVIAPKPVYHPPVIMPKIKPKPKQILKPKVVVKAPVVLPGLKLNGVMVGGDIDSAIIDDQTVLLKGFIKGARLDSVSNEGVELDYKGKKFYLKIE